MLAAAAYLLYPTAVPDSLVLGPVDVDSVFGADLVQRAKHYERFFYVDWVLAQIALLLTLWIYAKRGAAFARESSAGPIGTGMLLGMLGLAFAWIVHVPFALAAHWWQRRWDQNDLSYLDWLFQDWAVLAAQFLSICVALLIVMGLARKLGERWWLPGAAVFVGIAALFSFVSPYLDYTTTPLKDKALLGRPPTTVEARPRPRADPGREGGSDTRGERVRVRHRALAARRLWDTILRRPFTAGEQEVVLAHELGHHSRAPPQGHRLVRDLRDPRRLDPHARDPPPWRHGAAEPSRSRPRRRRAPACAAPPGELDLEAHGGRGRLEGAPVDARPRFEGLMVAFAKTSLVDPAPRAWADRSARIRRSSSASRWRGAPHGR